MGSAGSVGSRRGFGEGDEQALSLALVDELVPLGEISAVAGTQELAPLPRELPPAAVRGPVLAIRREAGRDSGETGKAGTELPGRAVPFAQTLQVPEPQGTIGTGEVLQDLDGLSLTLDTGAGSMAGPPGGKVLDLPMTRGGTRDRAPQPDPGAGSGRTPASSAPVLSVPLERAEPVNRSGGASSMASVPQERGATGRPVPPPPAVLQVPASSSGGAGNPGLAAHPGESSAQSRGEPRAPQSASRTAPPPDTTAKAAPPAMGPAEEEGGEEPPVSGVSGAGQPGMSYVPLPPKPTDLSELTKFGLPPLQAHLDALLQSGLVLERVHGPPHPHESAPVTALRDAEIPSRAVVPLSLPTLPEDDAEDNPFQHAAAIPLGAEAAERLPSSGELLSDDSEGTAPVARTDNLLESSIPVQQADENAQNSDLQLDEAGTERWDAPWNREAEDAPEALASTELPESSGFMDQTPSEGEDGGGMPDDLGFSPSGQELSAVSEAEIPQDGLSLSQAESFPDVINPELGGSMGIHDPPVVPGELPLEAPAPSSGSPHESPEGSAPQAAKKEEELSPRDTDPTQLFAGGTVLDLQAWAPAKARPETRAQPAKQRSKFPLIRKVSLDTEVQNILDEQLVAPEEAPHEHADEGDSDAYPGYVAPASHSDEPQNLSESGPPAPFEFPNPDEEQEPQSENSIEVLQKRAKELVERQKLYGAVDAAALPPIEGKDRFRQFWDSLEPPQERIPRSALGAVVGGVVSAFFILVFILSDQFSSAPERPEPMVAERRAAALAELNQKRQQKQAEQVRLADEAQARNGATQDGSATPAPQGDGKAQTAAESSGSAASPAPSSPAVKEKEGGEGARPAQGAGLEGQAGAAAPPEDLLHPETLPKEGGAGSPSGRETLEGPPGKKGSTQQPSGGEAPNVAPRGVRSPKVNKELRELMKRYQELGLESVRSFEHAHAEEYLKRALRIASEIPDPQAKAAIAQELGRTLIIEGELIIHDPVVTIEDCKRAKAFFVRARELGFDGQRNRENLRAAERCLKSSSLTP